MNVEALVGTIPTDWETTTLGDACSRAGGNVQTGPFGSQLHASDYVTAGIPSIMPQNLGDNRIVEEGIARITRADAERLARYRVQEGDIVYSRRGDVERRAIVRAEQDGWLCGTGCLRVRFGEGTVSPLYASYYLGHPKVREWIVRHAHGATMANLNTSILSSLPFVIPPLPDQRAIAHILGTLDDKIELNCRMNQTLEEIARAIFKSWFIDFDPVHAKSEGRQPEGMDAETAAHFPDAFVASKLGKIPAGWEVVPFSSAVQLIGGGTPKTSNPSYWNGNIPWFSVVDAPQDSDIFVLRTGKQITHEGLENCSARLLPVGTTIVSARGTVGRVALTGVPMAMNQSCYALRGRCDQSESFTYFATRSLVATLKQHTHGSVFDTITRDTFSNIAVLLPPQTVIAYFEDAVSPLVKRVQGNLQEGYALASLRDLLLPKLLSGELRVPEAARLVEQHV